MLINTVIKKEFERNEKMIYQYESLLENLPKGSLICRKNRYYYLKYRENGRICDKYIGKDSSVIEDIKIKLELRDHYSKMLVALKEEQKILHKFMEDLSC